jgi:hypothetical protein
MPAIAADAGVVAIAIVALIVVMAVYFLLQAIYGFFQWAGVPNIPLIGGSIMSAIAHLVGWVGGAASWLWAHANPITIVVASVHWLLDQLNTWTAAAAATIYTTLSRIVTQTIPAWYHAAIGVALAEYNAAVAYTASVATNLTNSIHGYYNLAIAQINSDIAFVEHYAVGLYQQAIGAVNTGLASAEASALGLVQTLQGWVVQELGQLRTWVTGEIAHTAAGIETDIGNAVRGVENTLAPEIAGAAAIGSLAIAEFAQWRTKCGDPLCNNLGAFGNAINAIESLLEPVALLAILAEIAHNPQGAVDEVATIGHDVVIPMYDSVQGILGLPRAA